MNTKCSRCGIHFSPNRRLNLSSEAHSYGLCNQCAHEFKAQTGKTLVEYLESQTTPTLTVSESGEIHYGNEAALSFLGGTPRHYKQAGDVFGCQYAKLPEGCERAIHCSGCAIRQAITYTLETGRGAHHIPTTIRQQLGTQHRRLELYISTHIYGGVVFLHIDSVIDIQIEKEEPKTWEPSEIYEIEI